MAGHIDLTVLSVAHLLYNIRLNPCVENIISISKKNGLLHLLDLKLIAAGVSRGEQRYGDWVLAT